MYATSMAQRNG